MASDVIPGVSAPQIITQYLFPNIYSLEVPEMSYANTYDVVPGVYSYSGLPATMTASIDPRYVTGPQKYEYKYKNQQGVEVVLRGTYNDVMSAIDVLNTYPPTKRACTDTGKKYVPLYGPDPNAQKQTPTVPTVGQIKQGNYVHIQIDNKTYSGSGAVIMVVEKSAPSISAKFVLFKGSKDNQYQETGGKIDISIANNTQDTIFKNAKKETQEESANLFDLDKESPHFVDIESTTDNTYYRVYLYIFQMTNSANLKNLYNENHQFAMTYQSQYPKDFMETDDIDLFDYSAFMRTLKQYNPLTFDTKSGQFQTALSFTPVSVRGRTMKAIATMNNAGLFTKAMSETLKEYTPSKPGSGIFNVINLS